MDNPSHKTSGTRYLLTVVHVAALLPLALLIWGYTRSQLTANPIREITLRTGRYALILIILSLACTPAYTLLGFKPARRLRRPLGLYAFMYAGLHLLIFVGLDYGFNVALIVPELLQRRFIQVGALAFSILAILAITSTRGWIRRLGKNWKRLHRLVYVAALLVIVHFIQVVKADLRRPLLYGAAVLVLLAARIPGVHKAFAKWRDRQNRRKPRDA
ncbi:MAG: sulfoxide reductase heme-binding subunit YedZ [Anaerolineae bacterium]|nr:sulfoxide reductase heme-binding subunit YedZ [Anaerolineae bacterium]